MLPTNSRGTLMVERERSSDRFRELGSVRDRSFSLRSCRKAATDSAAILRRSRRVSAVPKRRANASKGTPNALKKLSKAQNGIYRFARCHLAKIPRIPAKLCEGISPIAKALFEARILEFSRKTKHFGDGIRFYGMQEVIGSIPLSSKRRRLLVKTCSRFFLIPTRPRCFRPKYPSGGRHHESATKSDCSSGGPRSPVWFWDAVAIRRVVVRSEAVKFS